MRRYPHPRWERSFVQAGQTFSAEYLNERVPESFVQCTFSSRVSLCICIRLKLHLATNFKDSNKRKKFVLRRNLRRY